MSVVRLGPYYIVVIKVGYTVKLLKYTLIVVTLHREVE